MGKVLISLLFFILTSCATFSIKEGSVEIPKHEYLEDSSINNISSSLPIIEAKVKEVKEATTPKKVYKEPIEIEETIINEIIEKEEKIEDNTKIEKYEEPIDIEKTQVVLKSDINEPLDQSPKDEIKEVQEVKPQIDSESEEVSKEEPKETESKEDIVNNISLVDTKEDEEIILQDPKKYTLSESENSIFLEDNILNVAVIKFYDEQLIKELLENNHIIFIESDLSTTTTFDLIKNSNRSIISKIKIKNLEENKASLSLDNDRSLYILLDTLDSTIDKAIFTGAVKEELDFIDAYKSTHEGDNPHGLNFYTKGLLALDSKYINPNTFIASFLIL